jgi:hypothetical protein
METVRLVLAPYYWIFYVLKFLDAWDLFSKQLLSLQIQNSAQTIEKFFLMKNFHIFGSYLKIKQVLIWKIQINCAEFAWKRPKGLIGTWKQMLTVLLIIYFMLKILNSRASSQISMTWCFSDPSPPPP